LTGQKGSIMSHEQHSQLWGIVLAAGDGTRAREFLVDLLGGRGIKQFCAVIGRRSMLQHTLARVETRIPRERILVVVGSHHRPEANEQLHDWPADNLLFQPLNRDTAPGLLLPLTQILYRDPQATVAIFPSDHFILQEDAFMKVVDGAVKETKWFPNELILLGMAPDGLEDGYGWIEPAARGEERATLPVRRFWEKPHQTSAQALLARGALWNTFVMVAAATTLWEMMRRVAPEIHEAFTAIRQTIGHPRESLVIKRVYETLPALNFSTGVCEPLASELRVLPAPDVGWSDWGSKERICASLKKIGKLEVCMTRLRHSRGEALWPFPVPELISPTLVNR
jgi:mannose-1-phosphate guanylyltransferase